MCLPGRGHGSRCQLGSPPGRRCPAPTRRRRGGTPTSASFVWATGIWRKPFGRDDRTGERSQRGKRLASTGVDVQRAARPGQRLDRERRVAPRRLRIVAPSSKPGEVPALERGLDRLVDQLVGGLTIGSTLV